jgi:hypothetical protein
LPDFIPLLIYSIVQGLEEMLSPEEEEKSRTSQGCGFLLRCTDCLGFPGK